MRKEPSCYGSAPLLPRYWVAGSSVLVVFTEGSTLDISQLLKFKRKLFRNACNKWQQAVQGQTGKLVQGQDVRRLVAASGHCNVDITP